MQIITINLPEKYMNAIQILTDNNFYPSRSQVIRIALQEFLIEDFRVSNELEPENFEKIITSNRGVLS